MGADEFDIMGTMYLFWILGAIKDADPVLEWNSVLWIVLKTFGVQSRAGSLSP